MTSLAVRARAVADVVALPVVLLVVWWFATASSTSFFVPPLSKILSAFGDVWFSDRFVTDVVPSIVRLSIGYVLGSVIGIGVGLVLGLRRGVRESVEPVLEFVRAIPPPVLVPILILFAGIGDTMKVLVIVSGCVWPILLNTAEGVRAVDPVFVETARSFRFGTRTRLTRVVLPAASPQIFAGLRQGLSIAIILMVISEMFAASNGLGFTVVGFQRSFAIPEMWSGIILLGLLGFALSVLFRTLESRALRWYEGIRAAERGGRAR